MQETPIDAMRKRKELKRTRNRLFKRFLKHPMDTYLALKIKTIDDQVAECSEQMRQENKQRDTTCRETGEIAMSHAQQMTSAHTNVVRHTERPKVSLFEDHLLHGYEAATL